jgi:hypothetical protein
VFSGIEYQWRVWQLNRELDRIERHYRAKGDVAANASALPWSSPELTAKYTVMNKISVLETTYLLRRAARQKVPTPDNDDQDAWIEARGGGWYLSDFAYSNLRAAIRKERNERWDFGLKVFGLVGSTAIGTIGALIGLVAALKK